MSNYGSEHDPDSRLSIDWDEIAQEYHRDPVGFSRQAISTEAHEPRHQTLDWLRSPDYHRLIYFRYVSSNGLPFVIGNVMTYALQVEYDSILQNGVRQSVDEEETELDPSVHDMDEKYHHWPSSQVEYSSVTEDSTEVDDVTTDERFNPWHGNSNWVAHGFPNPAMNITGNNFDEDSQYGDQLEELNAANDLLALQRMNYIRAIHHGVPRVSLDEIKAQQEGPSYPISVYETRDPDGDTVWSNGNTTFNESVRLNPLNFALEYPAPSQSQGFLW